MVKKVFLLMAAIVLMFGGTLLAQQSRGYTYHAIQVMDELGRKETSITSVDIYSPGTSTSQTIYADRGLANAITLPMTTSSTNTTLTNGYFYWWGPDGYDYTMTDGTRTMNNAFGPQLDGSVGTIVLPTWLQVATTVSYLDTQSVTFGTDSDWVVNGGGTTDLLSFTPATDGAVFRVGTSGTTANADLQWYTGTDVGLMISESGSTIGITGLTANINASSNYATNINTGTSTGSVTIGSGTAGAIAVDTTTTVAINADDSVGITTTGASADITVDATAGSVIIDGGEAIADAVLIRATGTAAGIDITSLADIDITTTGAAGEDISLVNTGGSIVLSATESAADAILIESTAGGVDILAPGAAAGEDIDIVATGSSVNITSTEDIATGIVLTGVGIDITASGGSAKDVDITCTSGSVNISGGEAAADAVVISAGTAAGGIDITSNADIDITTTGAATEDITITNTGGSVIITATEVVDDAVVITASSRGKIQTKGALNVNTTFCLFEDTPAFSKWGKDGTPVWGGAATGAAGDENMMIFPSASFTYHILGTQTLLGPAMDANGLNVSMDLTANDGFEMTPTILASGRNCFTAQTDAFYVRVKMLISDVSGTDDLCVGFRKAEAFQANVDDYDEAAYLNVITGNINTETILNNGVTTTTDTTDDWADYGTHTLEVFVSAAGVVTWKIDGSAASGGQAAFTFDAAEKLVPFLYFLHHTDLCQNLTLLEWESGLQY